MRALIDGCVTGFYSHDQKDDLLYDLLEAEKQIFEWKAHTLRSINQKAAKEEIVENLKENSAFIVMDWAMKFLQLVDLCFLAGSCINISLDLNL